MCVCVCVHIYIYIYIYNSFTYAKNDDNSRARYLIDVKPAGFQSQLEASRISSHSEEL